MKSLVTAGLASALAQGSIPSEIVYFPEGDNTITATVDGAPKSILVRVPPHRGHEIAATFQAALAKRQSENVRPHFGFDHKPGAASALPKSFRYEPGVGVMASVEWTGAGRAGIEGRDWSYFSPTFLVEEDGVPSGLPEKGELGSLVNNPAFRNIQRIAASDASAMIVSGSATSQIEARAQQLVSAGQATDLDDGISQIVAQEPALYRVSCAEKIRPEIAKEITEILEGMEPSARAKLSEIADEIYLKGEAGTETDAMVMAIQRNPTLYQQWRDDQQETFEKHNPKPPSKVGASGFEAKAQALVTAGQARNLSDALVMVFAADPDSYNAYLKSLA